MAFLIKMLANFLGEYNKSMAPTVPTVPSGWTAQLDSSVNKYYYIEAATSKTQWDPPEGTVMPEPKSKDEKKPDYMKMAKSSMKNSGFSNIFRCILPDHFSLLSIYLQSHN